jgi:hypothetical protein
MNAAYEDLRLLLLLNKSKIEGSGTQLKRAPNFVRPG